jgi:hypothetical protein
MKTNHNRALAVRNGWKSNGWIVSGTALASLVAGSLFTACLLRLRQVRADSNRVFELNVYHAVPGKVPALESRFRDASKLIASHDLNVVAYWVPGDDPTWTNDPAWANTFVYLVAHRSWDDANKNWDALHADPAFQDYVKSEHTTKLIENVDEVHMRPADFSAIK